MTSLVVATLGCCIASFLVCGIPFGLLIARGSEGHVDVRKVGSGNIGMTNVARSVGARDALLTFLCDAGKGVLCTIVARLVIAAVAFGGDASMVAPFTPFGLASTLVYASCVLGHVFSPYLHFHGGKGISVGFGAGLGMYWPVGVGLLVVFLLFAVPSRYVSLGSICAAASLPVICLALGFGPLNTLPMAIVAVVVIWSHRQNIRKLARHEERRFTVRKGGER